jgi:hypothetical protein
MTSNTETLKNVNIKNGNIEFYLKNGNINSKTGSSVGGGLPANDNRKYYDTVYCQCYRFKVKFDVTVSINYAALWFRSPFFNVPVFDVTPLYQNNNVKNVRWGKRWGGGGQALYRVLKFVNKIILKFSLQNSQT